MALIVVFENISGLAAVSDYRVRVFVNRTMIAGPFCVRNHKRSKGWKALIKKFVRLPDIQNKKE